MRRRHEIESALTWALQLALERYRAASAAFDEAINNIPSEIPHPDGPLRIKQTGNEKRSALEALNRALKRHNDFILNGKLPEEIDGITHGS